MLSGIAKGQLYGAAFLDMLLPILTMGYEAVNAMCLSRETTARHLRNSGPMCFPFGVEVVYDDKGLPSLKPIDPEHGASRLFHRLSVLLMMGPDAAKEVARHGEFAVEAVLEAGRSPGKSCAHVDCNDTGAPAHPFPTPVPNSFPTAAIPFPHCHRSLTVIPFPHCADAPASLRWCPPVCYHGRCRKPQTRSHPVGVEAQWGQVRLRR